MDESRKKKSIIITTLIHLVLFGAFWFIMAWRAPDPPNPEYGIELSFVEAISPFPRTPISKGSSEVSPQEEVETHKEQSSSSEQQEVQTETESPDVVEEMRDVEEGEEQSEQPVVEHVEPVNDVKEEEPIGQEEVKEIDQRAIYSKNTTQAESGAPSSGASLDFSGWMWDFKPQPNDQSTEEGMIVFEVTVDDVGEIIGLRTVKKTITPALERVYREAVQQLTFSPTIENQSVAPQSTGRITFVIQTK